ncbi:hypothetical protein Zmor_020248 [Zophobas morio]|uniref:Uncharacterized protein n=1 Tax=Zophobas morio TaxID=2755281 RepID=A0AA38M9U0_9CUCU|nr:hypothetical protein Zmor_020248 [Zophobas morio]
MSHPQTIFLLDLLFCESIEQELLIGCGFITRLGCTKPLWCIGNWCMASPPCSDITIRTARQRTVHQKYNRHSPHRARPLTIGSSGVDRNCFRTSTSTNSERSGPTDGIAAAVGRTRSGD